MRILGIVLIGLGMSAAAIAAPVPEVDPSSGISAIALLSGALLIVRGRRKK